MYTKTVSGTQLYLYQSVISQMGGNPTSAWQIANTSGRTSWDTDDEGYGYGIVLYKFGELSGGSSSWTPGTYGTQAYGLSNPETVIISGLANLSGFVQESGGSGGSGGNNNTITASGGDISFITGTYTVSGTYNNHDMYVHSSGNYKIVYYGGTEGWVIYDESTTPGFGPPYCMNYSQSVTGTYYGDATYSGLSGPTITASGSSGGLSNFGTISVTNFTITGTENSSISVIYLSDYATASNNESCSYSASSLPAGLYLENGTIYGTPSSADNGTYYVTVSATGCESATLTITANISADSGSGGGSSGGGPCIIKGTKVALANGEEKNIEDITYDDELLVWDFDNGKTASAKPAWICHGGNTKHLWKTDFANGMTLLTTGPEDIARSHRVLSIDDGKFSYLQDIVGKDVATINGASKLINCEKQKCDTDYYNLITEYHINFFANGILASCRLSNFAKIKDMKYENHSQNDIDYSDVPEYYVKALRLKDQPTDLHNYVNQHIISTALPRMNNEKFGVMKAKANNSIEKLIVTDCKTNSWNGIYEPYDMNGLKNTQTYTNGIAYMFRMKDTESDVYWCIADKIISAHDKNGAISDYYNWTRSTVVPTTGWTNCSVKVFSNEDCLDGNCFLKGTFLTLKDGTKKKIENITYKDELLTWDFDKGEPSFQKPIWIAKGYANYYGVAKFSNEKILFVTGNQQGDTHRIYDVDSRSFEYVNEMVGHKTMTKDGEIVTVTSYQVFGNGNNIECYNIITENDYNCYINDVFSSCSLNNKLYPIDVDMKYVKTETNVVAHPNLEGKISEKDYKALRINELPTSVDDYIMTVVNTKI